MENNNSSQKNILDILQQIIQRWFPITLLLVGIGLLIAAIQMRQTGIFKIACFAIILMGAISLIQSFNLIPKIVRLALIFVLVISSGWLSYKNFDAIKSDLDFTAKVNRHNSYVVERLKDIREAQKAYKIVNKKYCSDFDSLIYFVKTGKFTIEKSDGEVPDSLTEEVALERGLITRKTFQVSVKDSIFNLRYLQDKKWPFHLDSMKYIPFQGDAVFQMIADEQPGPLNTKLHYLHVVDTLPLDTAHQMEFGSTSVTTLNGNWKEEK